MLQTILQRRKLRSYIVLSSPSPLVQPAAGKEASTLRPQSPFPSWANYSDGANDAIF